MLWMDAPGSDTRQARLNGECVCLIRLAIPCYSNMEIEIKYYELLNLLPSCACAVVFIILLLLDACKAFKRKALWIPPESLILGALTIQLLTVIDYSHVSYLADKDEKEDQVRDLLYKHQLIIDCSRLTVCVFVSYLIPQMVRSRWTTVWSDIGALVLPVMFYMAVELYFVWKLKKAPTQSWWFMLSSITLFIASTLLLPLLSCAVFAGKSIRKVIPQKVPLALSCCESSNTEDHVLKCWIVIRASQPEYIMARSVFSSLAGLLVLVSVVILVIKWTFIDLEPELEIKITVVIEFAFVLVGSMVVLLRWFTSVMYFPKNVKVLFYMEDFWTRSIVDLKEDLDAQSTSNWYMKKRNRGRRPLQNVIVTFVATIRLHTCFLPVRICLQKLMVYLSKACWLLSEFVIGIIRPFIMSREKINLLSGSTEARDGHTFLKYKKALDFIRMPGEAAYSLWLANEWAFKQTKNHISEGVDEGKDSAELIKLRRHKKGSVEDEATSEPVLEEEKHLKYLGKNCWKMRANSLIYCMIYLYDGTRYKDIINDAIEACCQAWDFMDFIDRSDQEDEFVSLAADKAFYTLKNIWNKEPVFELLERKIKKPLKEDMKKVSARTDESQKFSCVKSQQDSQDWMKEALKINFYKTWKAFELNSVNQIVNLQCSLANVIFHCIDNEIEKALVENCNKWAEEGIEENIYHAAFITGKLKGVREKIGEGNDPDPDPA